MEYDSAIKNEILCFATKWMHLERILSTYSDSLFCMNLITFPLLQSVFFICIFLGIILFKCLIYWNDVFHGITLQLLKDIEELFDSTSFLPAVIILCFISVFS